MIQTHLDSTRSTSLTPRSRFLMKQLGRLLLTRLHKLKALTTHLGCIYRTAGVPKLKNPRRIKNWSTATIAKYQIYCRKRDAAPSTTLPRRVTLNENDEQRECGGVLYKPNWLAFHDVCRGRSESESSPKGANSIVAGDVVSNQS